MKCVCEFVRNQYAKEIKIREYQKGDEKEIVQLLIHCFDGWPHIDTKLTSPDYWKWKYQKCPKKSIISVAVHNKKIIACHHLILQWIQIKKEKTYSCASVDFAVHPDYRGMKLSSRISDFADERMIAAGIKIRMNFTGNRILISKYTSSPNPQSRRPYFPKTIINMTRIQNIEKQIKEMPVKYGFIKKIGVKALQKWNRYLYTIPQKDNTGTEKQIDYFPEKISELIDSIYQNFDYIIQRDVDFLNWKYSYPNLGDYRKTIVEQDNKIQGYSVLYINRYNKDYPIGYIVDLITNPDKPSTTNDLLHDATEYFDKNNVNIVNCMTAKGNNFEKQLVKHGFLDSRHKFHIFTSQQGSKDLEALKKSDPNKIHMAWGDFDILPVNQKNEN